MRQLFAIARLAMSNAIRSRVVASLLALLVLAVLVLPLTIKSDGTLAGHVRIVLSYTLGLSFAILTLATVWAGCAAVSLEIRDKAGPPAHDQAGIGTAGMAGQVAGPPLPGCASPRALRYCRLRHDPVDHETGRARARRATGPARGSARRDGDRQTRPARPRGHRGGPPRRPQGIRPRPGRDVRRADSRGALAFARATGIRRRARDRAELAVQT